MEDVFTMTFYFLKSLRLSQGIWYGVHSHRCCHWSGGKVSYCIFRLLARLTELILDKQTMCLLMSGGYQADQPAEATQEGADHQ